MAIKLMGTGLHDDNARFCYKAHSHTKPVSTFAECVLLPEFFARNEA
jgi:hypothetical protein